MPQSVSELLAQQRERMSKARGKAEPLPVTTEPAVPAPPAEAPVIEEPTADAVSADEEARDVMIEAVPEAAAPEDAETVADAMTAAQDPEQAAKFKEELTAFKELALDLKRDVNEAVTSILESADALSSARKLLASGAVSGILAIPKVDEDRDSFIARIMKTHPDWDVNVWRREDEAHLRKALPQNFQGKGW